MSTRAKDHHIDCDWHVDQYDFECTCGAVAAAATEKITPALAREESEHCIACDKLRTALEAASEHLDFCGYGDAYERECAEAAGLREAIAAALAAAPSAAPASAGADRKAVRVKLLEWYEPTDHPQDREDELLMAHGIGGRYSISEKQSPRIGGMGHLLWWPHDGLTFAEFRTVDEAKVAAQADYERRILSALAASSPASQEPVAKVTSRYMRAYYHEFEPTGMDRIDAILEAVAMAGRAYHSTELWDEAPEFGECGYWTLIQERAVAAATPETPGREDALRASERDVIAERRRQVEVEGWTPEHDDRHSDGELARAAGVYALASGHHDYRWVLQGLPVSDYLAGALKLWPWDWSWFKPKHRRQDLVKAGALILAEIERLDRAALAQPGPDARDEEGRDDA